MGVDPEDQWLWEALEQFVVELLTEFPSMNRAVLWPLLRDKIVPNLEDDRGYTGEELTTIFSEATKSVKKSVRGQMLN
jgi:hypothetical protein